MRRYIRNVSRCIRNDKPISQHPGRSEVRVRKRRPKAYPYCAAASFYFTSADGDRLSNGNAAASLSAIPL
ncbi:hypothetical protein [Fischerella sp. JS2]|uniref:hypothetical protein n=1 Tax=Fischerella sp. JS2 TaxID=2597771 RepID=UPI0028ED381A|nr:hypothetical protein [Fischerella sp. JS2]